MPLKSSEENIAVNGRKLLARTLWLMRSSLRDNLYEIFPTTQSKLRALNRYGLVEMPKKPSKENLDRKFNY